MRNIRAQWLAGAIALTVSATAVASDGGPFERIATFPVFLNTDVDTETVAEIVTSANDGELLLYTDGSNDQIGFIDITDPSNPQPGGNVGISGEPTSVGVNGDYALACTNTSVDFVNTSGNLDVIDIDARTVVRSIPLGGQPDAIAVSPDGRYAAICIENERDEDLGDGEPPQLPAGYLVIVDMSGGVDSWSTREVDLTGLADLYPEDPEPEFVDISALNIAVVTLQENNHIVLVYLPTGDVIGDFSAGTADLEDVDILENDLIEQTASLPGVPREPDAVTWTSAITFATADEGDLFGGSRGFTTWTAWGTTLYEPGNELEHLVARIGHYPEGRSENKGNEPEGIEFGRYGRDSFLFVGSERSSVIFVYEVGFPPVYGNARPEYRQVLPAGVAPEGLLAIPERDLFVVSCEDDARDDKIRSSVMIYARTGESSYPTIESANIANSDRPIPWAALSGLAQRNGTVYSVHDSFYQQSRFYTVDVAEEPAIITDETVLVDSRDVLFDALTDLKAQLPGTDDFDPANIVNEDGTVNLDLEGIETQGRGFWIASEGAGNLVDGVSNPDDRPFESPSLLARVDRNGNLTEVVLPPIEVVRNQFRFGFEGVARQGRFLYVAFQRSWSAAGDLADHARIGRYDRRTGEWTFAFYPLETPISPNGGWVGLSELTTLDRGEFAVIERDNQGGPDGAIKRVYSFSVRGVDFKDNSEVPNFDILSKELVIDLVAEDVYGPAAGLLPEKQEGMTIVDGEILIVNDNDGVDDNNGETRLLRIER